jgi:hypothetical protein
MKTWKSNMAFSRRCNYGILAVALALEQLTATETYWQMACDSYREIGSGVPESGEGNEAPEYFSSFVDREVMLYIAVSCA